ncbi:MAG: HAMP domain-containing protein [Chloroflexi bacterium]|nr:MAG: HAMP domain-containing protein [Chloroflexota bacterium]
MRRFRSLATGITLVSIAVAFIAIAIIVVGVLVVAQSTFNRLMIQAGTPAADAQAMFDHGVETIFLIAVLIAISVSVVLAVILAARLAMPLRRMTRAAERIAAGDYETRVPSAGPDELASLADSFNQMAASLAEQERERRDFIVNAAHELRTPLTNLQGYLEALRDGVIAPTPEQFGSLHEEAQRLVRLSRSLDALADNGHGDRTAVRQDIDLPQAVRSAFDSRTRHVTRRAVAEPRSMRRATARGCSSPSPTPATVSRLKTCRISSSAFIGLRNRATRHEAGPASAWPSSSSSSKHPAVGLARIRTVTSRVSGSACPPRSGFRPFV